MSGIVLCSMDKFLNVVSIVVIFGARIVKSIILLHISRDHYCFRIIVTQSPSLFIAY